MAPTILNKVLVLSCPYLWHVPLYICVIQSMEVIDHSSWRCVALAKLLSMAQGIVQEEFD